MSEMLLGATVSPNAGRAVSWNSRVRRSVAVGRFRVTNRDSYDESLNWRRSTAGTATAGYCIGRVGR